MIPLVLRFVADSQPLYSVSFDSALAIPIAYTIAFFVALLLKEFTRGIVKYTLAALFLGSFAYLWMILMWDYSPMNYVIAAVVLFGGVTGLWNWVRDIFRDIQKL